MDFYVNGEKIDVKLEDEKTIGDVLKSFEVTCEENNAAVIGISINGKTITADIFDEESKKIIGINDSIKEIPYIMVNSVDRNKEGVIHKPIRKGGYGRYFEENFVLLPISYEDFDLVKQASADLDSMNIISLFTISLALA